MVAATVPASATQATSASASASTSASASASAPASAPVRDPVPVVVVDCFGAPQVRPADYLLACGDGNNRLVGLRWDSWGGQTATASGTDMVNDCRPYCAAGRFRAYPVEVTLIAPQAWPERPGTQRYTSIRLVFPEEAPAPLPHDVTYNLVY
ncbi:hypothetical protein GPJ59_03485 [Streptomyces bambusae]|uniref:Secreted protein n=1 Tax=Streptomyces bambusae TaxID=1550616 RepID=A0ABS6Z061_9ACTN|nr:hypothetical protein [Streptomyces bambusae]